MTDISRQQMAKDYLKAGFSVIPLEPKEKRPCIVWQKYQSMLPTEKEIDGWYSQNLKRGVGIVTGTISNLVVVDIDKKSGGLETMKNLDLPPTAVVETGGGGLHYYYRLPHGAKLQSKNLGGGIEIKCDGAQVVAPPSIHPSGVPYKWQAPLENIINAPDWILQHSDKLNKYTETDWSAVFDEPITEGNRNNVITRATGLLIKYFPSNRWGEARKFLSAFNMANLSPPLEEKELTAVFKSVGRAELFKKESDILAPESILPSGNSGFVITSSAELLTKKISEFPYIVYGLVPEKGITAITAESGKGKSLFGLILASAIARGEKLFGELAVQKKKVLIIDQEMNEDIIAERYRSVIGDEPIDIDYLYEQAWKINDEKHLKWLIDTIKEKNYGVIIFDTFTMIHSLRENEADDMKIVNTHMQLISWSTNASIIYLHHQRKPQKGEKKGQSSARGSTEIISKTGSHILLESTRSKKDNQVITAMTITQEKARRPECITTIGVNVIFNENTKKCEIDYRGVIEANQLAVEGAKQEVIKLLKENENLPMGIDEFKSKIAIGESSIRTACQGLCGDEILSFAKGGKGKKLYFLNNA